MLGNILILVDLGRERICSCKEFSSRVDELCVVCSYNIPQSWSGMVLTSWFAKCLS